jgi:hypothetical protein
MLAHTWPPRRLREFTFWVVVPAIAGELVLSPFFFAHIASDYVWVPILQLMITAILLPVYLAFIGVGFIWRSSFVVGLGTIAILAISTLGAVCLDYAVWGLSTGRFWAPDIETVMIIRGAAQIGLVITLLPAVVALFFGYVTHRTQQNA